MWRPTGELKSSYDVVIIGGGAHGMAIAYYLTTRFGVRNIAVLDKSYIGSGASGRNTAIIRANYRTPECTAFYKESLNLYEHLSAELNFNLLFSQQGHMTLAHTDRAVITMNERAELNQLLGIDSRVIGPDEIARLSPEMDLSQNVTWPVMAALYHPPGGTIRHDAVVWGYARGADKGGAEIHPFTEVKGVARSNGRVTGVQTTRGDIKCGTVISATAGWSTLIADMVGVRLPITTHILQALVTEALKPFLDVVVVSSQMHVYISQTDRGEILIGAEIEPYTTYRGTSTFGFMEDSARHTLELFPQLQDAKILRQWTGLCDLSPDYSPIMGLTEVGGFLISTGWGTYGFKAAPIAGLTMADLAATGKVPSLIQPFTLERFYTDTMVSEIAAAAVSH